MFNCFNILQKLLLICLLLVSVTAGVYAVDGFLPVIGENTRRESYQGEDLAKIAAGYRLAIDHIMLANQIQTLKVPYNTSLLIPSRRILPDVLEEGVVINIPERMLYFFSPSHAVRHYPIAVGAKKWMTPVATTKIINKSKDPTWIPPDWAGKDKKPVEPGPENPLGDRWIGIDLPGYGIHSTNDPLSVGMVVSHGCIRMNPEDAKELFDLVRVGMTVKIVYKPVLIGRSESDGIIYMSVYPDVYDMCGDMDGFTLFSLRSAGIEELVDTSAALVISKRRTGVCAPVLGIATKIFYNNVEQPMPLPPFMIEGKIFVPASVFAQMGIGVNWNKQDGFVEFSRNGKLFTLPADRTMKTAYIWKGRLLLPLRESLQALGFVANWNSALRRVDIFQGAVNDEESRDDL